MAADCCWRFCLFARVPLAPLLRVIWFTPVLMSYVVVGIIWVWIYDYDWGVVNVVLRWRRPGRARAFLAGRSSTALWSVLVTHLWKWLGFNMIVCLAALHALPGEVLGAAELDNCGWFAKLVYIIIPMLRPTLVNLLVLSFIGKMMIFDLVWIMTGGGPAVVDRNGVDLRLQAGLRLEHLRPRLPLGDRRAVVPHHPGLRRDHDAAAAPARPAGVLDARGAADAGWDRKRAPLRWCCSSCSTRS